jgi:hypothetical protein
VENHRERKRNRLTERLAKLERQWKAANDQRDATLNWADRGPLDQQIKRLDEEIEEVEKELAEMDAESDDPNRRHLDFEEKIHRIDFAEVKSRIRTLIDQAKNDGAASLFLLQKSNALGGRWCIDAIRHELAQGTFDFKQYPIGFNLYDRRDEHVILDRLAGRLNVEPVSDDLDRYTHEVVQRLCAAIQIGSVVLIEIHQWDYFHHQERVFKWFVESFWARLARSFRAHDKRRNAKLVVVLVADTAARADWLQALCLEELNPEIEKLQLLPLRNWTREEIEDWLASGAVRRGDAQTIIEMAELIYSASDEGRPPLVYEALRKYVFNKKLRQ